MFAKELVDNKIKVLVADTNWDAIRAARMENIPSYFGNPMSEHASRTLELSEYGTVLVISPYRQLNPMVTFHFEDQLGKGTVFGLSNNEQQQRPSHQVSESYAKKLGLFAEGITYGKLASWVAKGYKIKTTRLTDSFTMQDYLLEYNDNLLPLCALDSSNRVHLFTTNNTVSPKSDWKVISLIFPREPKVPLTAVKEKEQTDVKE
jgi:hypothetical protein